MITLKKCLQIVLTVELIMTLNVLLIQKSFLQLIVCRVKSLQKN